MAPTMGMMMSPTSELTIRPNAPPMMTPTARSAIAHGNKLLEFLDHRHSPLLSPTALPFGLPVDQHIIKVNVA